MIPEQALEHGAQIGGGLEVALLVELGLLQSRPVRDHAAAPQCTAGEEGDGAGAVIGAVGAVDARGASELRDDGDHRLAPGFAHVALDRRQRTVERPEEVGKLTGGRALVDVCVPPDKADRPDTRAVGLGEKARRSAGGLREIGPHACNAGSRQRRTVGH